MDMEKKKQQTSNGYMVGSAYSTKKKIKPVEKEKMPNPNIEIRNKFQISRNKEAE